ISGGMQRRLALAATLVHDPQIVFLDEPTAGIDPILRRKFWDQFQELKKQGKTLVITTQYVNEAAYCDYVGIMSDGKLIMVSTPEGLRKRAYGGDVLMLRTKTPLTGNQTRELDKLTEVVRPVNLLQDGSLRLIVDEASTATPVITDWLKEQGVEIESIEEYLPAYDDVFVKVIQDYDRETAAAAAVQTAEEVKS
ncbi:MAG TPA: DUF4162 domain-containing protein, partial [Bellilinea sp.]|nr:DUF4162 domain-containing protein [Bellilinea sp.]